MAAVMHCRQPFRTMKHLLLVLLSLRAAGDAIYRVDSREVDYDEDDDEDFEQDPPFKYEYGFNALSFVADYLRAHNPNNPDKDFEEEFSGSDEDKPPATPPEEMDEVTKLLS